MAAKEYSPDVVAQSFIKQFYEMLAENPSELHRFYMAESFFTHCEGQQTTPAVQGVEAIRARVAELQLAGARVDLSEGSVDAQRSDINGVFMVVTGEITQPSRSLEPKRFVQSFFLASQTPTSQVASMASYFVRNSVFRLLNGPSTSSVSVSVQASAAVSAVVDASTATPAPVTSSTSTSTAEPVKVPVPAPVEVVPEVVVVVEVPAPVVEIVPEVVPEVIEAPVVPVPEVPSVPSAPRSYSDMARAAASSSQAPVSPARFGARPSAVRPAASAPKAEAPKASPVASGPSASLYVKQAPEAATEAEVLALFSRFGAVKRVELNSQRGFAFVDYESAASVQACLASCKEAPLELLGAALKVEERNSRGGGGPGANNAGGRNKSGPRREGENRERREGGGRGQAREGTREGGDRTRERRGPKPESNGTSNGTTKTAAPSEEANGARAAKK